MAAPYSLDLRKQILKDYDNGVPIEDCSHSRSTVNFRYLSLSDLAAAAHEEY